VITDHPIENPLPFGKTQPAFSLALSINHHSIHNATTSMATQAARLIKRNLFILTFISELLGRGGTTTFILAPKKQMEGKCASCIPRVGLIARRLG
jgi:hypothetical protein